MTRESNPEAMEDTDQRVASDNGNAPQHRQEAGQPDPASRITSRAHLQPVAKSGKLRDGWQPEDVDQLMQTRAANEGATWDQIRELTGSEGSAKALQIKHAREEKARSQAAEEVRSEGAGTTERHASLPPLTTKPEGSLSQDTATANDGAQEAQGVAQGLKQDINPDDLAENYLLAMGDSDFEAANSVIHTLNDVDPYSAITITSELALEQMQEVVNMAKNLKPITQKEDQELYTCYYAANAATQHLGIVLGVDQYIASTASSQTFKGRSSQQPLGPNFKFMCDVPRCDGKIGGKYSFARHMRSKHSATDPVTGISRSDFEITSCDDIRKTWDAKSKTDPSGAVKWTGHFWDVALEEVATADLVEEDESEDMTV